MSVETFSRYELKEELGQGGMATVYRAYDPLFEREVALKILKKELLANSQIRERFERETKIIARLEHAAIVPVYDVGRDKDQLFFVMRYMSGGSLADRIQNGSMTFSEIAYIIQRVAAALDYAHDKGVIHRDLKPGNILFDEYNNPYISDFGIAKLTQASIKLTNSGIIGTPTYMSPEQAQGEEVDGRSDIYSLGVILFEMLSGKTPYEATTPLGMAFKHASDPVPHIRKINPNLPDTVETIIEKVMAKDRDQRYSTGMDFANDFSATLTEDSKLVAPVPERVPIKVNEGTAPPSTATRKRQPLPRSWMLGGAMLIVLVAFWGVPRFTASLNPTSETATTTVTLSAPTNTPTQLPASISTAVQTATVEVEPTVVPILTIGGADKIALTANKDIFIMDLDGSNIQQLTNTNVPKFDLQWLPNGQEILYGERNCIYTINVESTRFNSEEIACFNDEDFDGFRVSPNGTQVAISIGNRLLVLPFDPQTLSEVASTFELQGFEDLCLDYADVSVKGAQWSADGQRVAITYESVVSQRIGDTIRVLDLDPVRCQAVDPLIMDEFPAKHFTPEGYERYPLLPSYHWDGDQQFLFNSFKRNAIYGELYLYDMSTATASKINPVDGVCCYGSAVFSPNGTHILFVFQDVRSGENSVTQLYYIPMDQIGKGETFTPIRLPLQFFPDLREEIELALRPVTP
ncbi:MAG TPA: protein kinase [Anaerolineales bacterium]|nr:protein kinase [Anaerolineales bacterium]